MVETIRYTDYAFPAWHTSLTKNDTETLGNIQKRAMSIIFPGINYHEALKISKLPTLSYLKIFFIHIHVRPYNFKKSFTY